MKNICCLFRLLAVMAISVTASFAADVWDGSVAESFGEGKGTAAEPYKISNGAELALFAQKVSAGDTALSAVLTNDIYLNDSTESYEKWGEEAPKNTWVTSIGAAGHMYQGKFDGKGHKVYGIFLDSSFVETDYQGYGLFGNVGDSAKIMNVGVSNSFIHYDMTWDPSYATTHSVQVGLLAGRIQGTHVTNVFASGVVITNAKNSTTVAKYSEVGCAIGYANNGAKILNVYAGCNMESGVQEASSGAVYHSYGGAIGKLNGKTFVENVYSTSTMKDASAKTPTGDYKGGVVGDFAIATDSLYIAYYNISTIGTENAPATAIGNSKGVSSNVASKTTAKMKSEDFASLLGTAFTYTANLNDGYPQPVVFEGAAAFDGGDGTEESPYLIGSAKALRAVSGLVNGMNVEFGGKSYKMTADVELNEDAETYKSWETTPPEFSWYQIGRDYHRKDTISVDCSENVLNGCGSTYFSGSFNGAGHSVKGVYISDTTNQSQGGLFNYVRGAIIKNIGVEQSFISVKGRAGGILGTAYNSMIDSCHNSAEIRSISQDNGGIAGGIFTTTVSNCQNTGNLIVTQINRSAHSNAGIVGEAFLKSTIRNCWNTGSITANAHVVGIVSLIDSSLVENVYNRGTLTVTDSLIAGIAETIRYSGTLRNAYNAGKMYAGKNVVAYNGGVVSRMITRSGAKVPNVVSDCYYDSQAIVGKNSPTTAIGTTSGTITNVSALPTASMTTGRFAIMLGDAYKQDDAVNDGYPTFLAEGETYGVEDIFAGGDGSEENPFLIATATQLRNMEYLVNKKNAEYGNKSYKVIADIALNENSSEYESWGTTAPTNTWTPMGSSESVSFNGNFDGGNFVISGIYTNTTYSGLFGFVGPTGVVKNFTISESYVKTTAATGLVASVAAYNYGTISGVTNEGFVYANMTTAGSNVHGAGVVAFSNGGKILNAQNKGTVQIQGASKGNNVRAGGIVGKALKTEISGVINSGNVTSRSSTNNRVAGYSYAGGIAAMIAESEIKNAKNTGKIYAYAADSSVKAVGWARVGGIAGVDSVSSNISWCINEGSVEGYVNSADSSNSVVNLGGILGDHLSGTSSIKYCSNNGDLTGTSKYSYAKTEMGGILGFNRGTMSIENCYVTGLLTAVSTATSYRKSANILLGGIAGYLKAGSTIRGSYFAGRTSATVSGTTTTKKVGGLVANNLGEIVGSYFDSETSDLTAVVVENSGTLTKSKSLTTAEMQTNEFAWKLNTLGGDSTNSGAYTRYNSYPVFADESYLPIRRVVFDDEINITNAYTSYKGYISAPADPEPAAGYQFVGWTDGDKYMLQNRQVIEKDMTLYALFTLVTEPVYFITFVDGGDIYVKATETTGKVAAFPIAKNIPMGYHFDGWYDNATNKAVDEDAVFTGTATVVAKFTANLYAITFLDYDGTKLQSSDVAYGSIPTAPSVIRESSEEYSYTFAGWTPTIENVSGEATYTAVYDSTKIESSSSEEILSSSTEESSSSEMVESSSSEEIPASSAAESSSSGSVKSSSSNVSSSSVASSSSAKSSSSTAKSSSSVVKSSSSTEKSSSSEAESSSSTKTSSSSSKKDSSSSSKNEDAIITIATVPHFNVSVAGRSLQISGVKLDSKIAVFDIRGNVMYAGFAYAENFSIDMQNSGRYLVRVGTRVQVVNIR